MTEDTMDRFHRQFGKSWPLPSEYSQSNMREEEIAREVIDDFRESIEKTISMASFSNLVIHVRVFSEFDTRCVVWSPDKSSQIYVIGISSGAIANNYLRVADEDFWKKYLDSNELAKKFFENDTRIREAAFRFVLYMLAYHELGHIVRGHIGYKREGSSSTTPTSEERVKLCEVDADSLSGSLLATEVEKEAQSLIAPALVNIPDAWDTIVSEVLKVLSVALYLAFSFFNRKDYEVHSLYPHPMIRAIRIAAVSASTASSEKGIETVAISRTVRMMDALEQAQLYVDEIEAQEQEKWELGEELAKFDETIVRRLDALNKELVGHVPPRNA